MPIRAEMRDRYPKDWALRSRFVRDYRAKRRCEWCGVDQYAVIARTDGKPMSGNYGRGRDQLGVRLTYQDARQIAIAWDKLDRWPDEEGPPLYSVAVLTVAHVFDHRPEAASLLNLACLCQRCHNRHDMAHRRAGIRERARSHTADLFTAADRLTA